MGSLWAHTGAVGRIVVRQSAVVWCVRVYALAHTHTHAHTQAHLHHYGMR